MLLPDSSVSNACLSINLLSLFLLITKSQQANFVDVDGGKGPCEALTTNRTSYQERWAEVGYGGRAS